MSYFTFILSLLNPVYALIFSITGSIKRSSNYLVLSSFALAFALISFSIKPLVELDLYRHYIRIENLLGLSFNKVLDTTDTGYLLFDIYAWLIINLGFPKQIFTASIIFISYMLVLSVYKDIKSNYLQHVRLSTIAVSFLIFWLSIDFVLLSSGIRSIFANIIVFYVSYYLIFNSRFLLFIFGVILAFFIHPGSLVPSLLISVAILSHRIIKKPKMFVIIGLVLIVGSSIVYNIIEFISSYLVGFSFYSPAYLSQDNTSSGAGSLQARNLNGIFGDFIIARLPGYIAFFYLLLLKNRSKDPLYLTLCLGVLYLGLFFQYFTIYERFNSFFVLLFSLFIIIEYSREPNNFNKLFIIFFSSSLVIYSIFNLFRYYSYLSSAVEVLYKPLFLIVFNI